MAQELCYRCYYPIERETVKITDEGRAYLLQYYDEDKVPSVGKVIWVTRCGQCGMSRNQLGQPTKSPDKSGD